nr:transcription factor 25 [Ipomoea batatas]
MSARLMKKILKEQEAALHQEDSEDDSESPDSSTASRRNPFDILDEDEDEEKEQHNDSDDVDQVDKSEINDRSSTVKVDTKNSSKTTDTINTSASSNQRSKKKKKKSKENLHTSTRNPQKSLDVMLENLSVEGDSSCRKDIASHSTEAKVINTNSNKSVKKSSSSILQIDPKFLSAENELRRIFGSKVVSSFERNNQSGSSRQARGIRRGSQNHRKTILVHPSEHWPRWDGSLTMELLETRDEINYFRYVHSASYSQAQRAFEAAKAIHDLNGIVNILVHHPYHIDSLITLAEYYKFSGELQMSSDATARCLYAMECAWHAMFTPFQGKCQLQYSHDTNKPFFSVLFSHMKNMDRRGCHRSALEICKLLLSLDSDDPMGALFCIDYYSLRAEEYSWLERFSEEYKSDNSLWLFPNFSYSLAICRFNLESREDDKKTESLKASSTDLMKQALMLHPTVLKKLVAKVPLKDQTFSRILGHSLFASDKSGSLSLDHLVNIYVERSYLIWRLPDIQKFLKDSALSVIEMLEKKEADSRDWTCVRKEAFSSDKNEYSSNLTHCHDNKYSHLLVSEFSDSVPTLPPDNLQNFMVDPRLAVNNGEQPANRPIMVRSTMITRRIMKAENTHPPKRKEKVCYSSSVPRFRSFHPRVREQVFVYFNILTRLDCLLAW